MIDLRVFAVVWSLCGWLAGCDILLSLSLISVILIFSLLSSVQLSLLRCHCLLEWREALSDLVTFPSTF